MSYHSLRVVLILTVIFGTTGFAEVNLKFVKALGDERENYTFYALTGAALSPGKDIYILDGKGFFLAQYSWNGTFIRRTGQKGQGPSDFFLPFSLDIYDGKLLVLDSGNRRLARCGLNLDNFEYFEMPLDHKFSNHVVQLKNHIFLGPFTNFREDRGRLGAINRYGDLEYFFFNRFPVDISLDAQKLTEANDFKTLLRHRVISDEFIPVFGVDEKREQVLVSFRNPDNPVRFFVYTIDGREIRNFSYTIKDNRYRFSQFLLDATIQDIANPLKYPKERFQPGIYSLFVYRNHYIVNLWLEKFQRDQLVERRCLCLVFNHDGKLKGEIEVKEAMRFFSISPEGYLLAGAFDEDIVKLYIFKLEL